MDSAVRARKCGWCEGVGCEVCEGREQGDEVDTELTSLKEKVLDTIVRYVCVCVHVLVVPRYIVWIVMYVAWIVQINCSDSAGMLL